jgi:hypothetical protein
MAEPKIEWANNGEAFEQDVDGEKITMFAATIDLGDGSAIQKFEGESHKEIAEKLLTAQMNASRRINELKQGIQPTPAPAKKKPFERKPLDANKQFEVAQDLTDASKATEAIRTAVEAELGAPLETVREVLNTAVERNADDEARQLEEQVAEAIAQFREEATDFVLCQHNEDLIIKYGELHNLTPTDVQSYHTIWTALKKAGLAQLTQPTTPTTPVTPPGPLPTRQTRPRLGVTSSSLRRGDSADAALAATKPKYTREDLDKMPIDVYEHKMKTEPGFAQLVDSL